MSALILDDGNWTEEVEASDLPVVVDVTASWCPACRQMEPVIQKLADDLQGKVKVGKLDSDRNRRLVRELGVDRLPTILFFKRGVVVDRMVGACAEQTLLHRIHLKLGVDVDVTLGADVTLDVDTVVGDSSPLPPEVE